jgi:chromosome segregation ATPase
VMKEADKIKSSIAHKVQRLSHHNSCRQDLNIRLEKALQSVDDVDTELNAASIDNNKSDKLLSLLSAHVEILVRKAVALTENEDEAKEQIKMKHLIITDLKSNLHESSKRLLDISALYATLKNEKDIITAARVASSEKIAGSEKDMTVANLQLESLLSDYNQKSCVLLKHQDSHENSRVLRATLQTEKANVSFLLREKKEELNRQQLQMKNLRASLMTLQREISMQQSRKRSLLSANRLLSKKLRETTSEICRSHQRASLQERLIKESDISTRQRKEDIRLLSLKVLFQFLSYIYAETIDYAHHIPCILHILFWHFTKFSSNKASGSSADYSSKEEEYVRSR